MSTDNQDETPVGSPPSIDERAFSLPPDFTMKALSFLNQTWNLVSSIASNIFTVSKDIYRAVQPNIYVFFKDSSFPYRVADYNLSAPGIPPIAWYYSCKDNVFLTSELFNSSGSYHTQHLPWLTAQIKYNELVLYDISDFIQSIRWAGEPNQAFPSPSVLIAAWSLQSGVILNVSDATKLEVINDSGDIETISLR